MFLEQNYKKKENFYLQFAVQTIDANKLISR